ncbi:MAG: YraN family protein [Nitrospiraceae bacterium]|nr:YraN family protein [Nitrospiraceae bacterium]
MNNLGKKGEDAAAVFLKEKGFKILRTNYRTPFGEIDIIAKDGDVLVFVEVKTRADDAFGSPFEAVTRRKREKIKKVALCFMKGLRKETAARFDVLSIMSRDGRQFIEHIPDAFET